VRRCGAWVVVVDDSEAVVVMGRDGMVEKMRVVCGGMADEELERRGRDVGFSQMKGVAVRY